MKKEYNPVEIEMIRFDSEDIITTSGGDEKKRNATIAEKFDDGDGIFNS